MSASLVATLLMSLLAPMPDDLALITKPPVPFVKFVGKSALKTYKTVAATALKELDTALDDLEAQLDENIPPIAVSAFWYAAISTCLDTLAAAQATAILAVEQATVDVLSGVQPQEPVIAGQYPPDLLYGGDGALDSHRAKLLAAVKKSHASLRKRLAKSAALVESRSGIGLAVFVVPSEAVRTLSVMQVDTGLQNYAYGLDLDLALAASRLDVVGDAVLIATGRTPDQFSPVDLVFVHGFAASEVPGVIDVSNGRFTAIFQSGGGSGAPEGSWALVAEQGGRSIDGISIGVR